MGEYDEDFLLQPTTTKILEIYKEGRLEAAAKTKELFELFSTTEADFDFKNYMDIIHRIVNKYVVETFNELSSCVKP